MILEIENEPYELHCPKCKEMTRTDDIPGGGVICLECGTIFSVNEGLVRSED